jgi:hypothetical protein
VVSVARGKLGVKAASSKLEDMYEAAKKALAENGAYILTPVELVRGPEPLIICATDTQMHFTCSFTHFLSQMFDVTFSELKELDDFDVHSPDYNVGMTMCLWRAYCNGKSADAHQVRSLVMEAFGECIVM